MLRVAIALLVCGAGSGACSTVVTESTSLASEGNSSLSGAADGDVRTPDVTRVETEIQAAEEAFFEQFNAVNENEEFEIECRDELVDDARQRVCLPLFWWKSNADTAVNYLKQAQMDEEMRRLVGEHPELWNALLRLATLKEADQRDAAP